MSMIHHTSWTQSSHYVQTINFTVVDGHYFTEMKEGKKEDRKEERKRRKGRKKTRKKVK